MGTATAAPLRIRRLSARDECTQADLLVQRAAAAHALDCLQRGLIVADECSRVVFSNRTAQHILCQADGLTLAPDGLHAARPRDSADLRGLVRHAATAEDAPPAGVVISLWRPSLNRMLLVRISPIQVEAPVGYPLLRRAALFVHDPAFPAVIDESALSHLYGLTRAESHLLALLVDGKTLADAAAVLHVSANTARTHLKHIFMKTDTNRQTQLVAILVGSVVQASDLR